MPPLPPPLLTGHLRSVSWLIYEPVSGRRSQHLSLAGLKLGARLAWRLYDTPEVLRNLVPLSFLSGTGSGVCPTQLWENQAAAV